MTEPKDKCLGCKRTPENMISICIYCRLRQRYDTLREASRLAADFIDGFVVDVDAGHQDPLAEAAYKALVSALKDSQ